MLKRKCTRGLKPHKLQENVAKSTLLPAPALDQDPKPKNTKMIKIMVEIVIETMIEEENVIKIKLGIEIMDVNVNGIARGGLEIKTNMKITENRGSLEIEMTIGTTRTRTMDTILMDRDDVGIAILVVGGIGEVELRKDESTRLEVGRGR